MKLSFFDFLKAGTFLVLSIIIVSGCQDPILVGSELLDDEKIHVDLINDFDIATATVPGVKVVTKSSSSKLYRLGEVNDNIFGKSAAAIYMKFGFNVAATPSFAVEPGATFDSLVLVLRYDSLATYGQASGLQNIKIYQLEEPYKSTDTFYSDTQLSHFALPIANLNKYINPKDSVTIVDHTTGNTVRQEPQLRLRLDDAFARTIFNNPELIRDSLFRDYFKGIYITSQSEDGNPLMYGFDLSSAALSASTLYNKLKMYYTVADTLKKVYDFAIDYAVINSYSFDRSGSTVGAFMDQQALGDSLVFTQGLGGVKTEISFKDIDRAKSLLINKAELEIFIADVPGLPIYTKNPPQLIATVKNAKGNYEFIEDIAIPVSLQTSFVTSFGGTPIPVPGGYRYKLNITNHLKKAIRNSDFSPTLYLSVLTESENPDRTVFYGAKNSKNPVKLNIYYTKN